MADEKHSWLAGERVYIATTVAEGCILGARLATTAGTQELKEAYGEFQQEALALKPDYAPRSVNTDGWEATQKAWRSLFPGITIVLCFLHAVLNIQRCCRTLPKVFSQVTRQLWELYQAKTKPQFSERLEQLSRWASEQMLPESIQDKLSQFASKAEQFQVAFDVPNAHRTSNMIDRLMNYQDRLLYAMQYFHGSQAAANQHLRAMAILWNFHPYCCRIQKMDPYTHSPFEDLNGFQYHDNWLRNFLIASSLNGHRPQKSQKHTKS